MPSLRSRRQSQTARLRLHRAAGQSRPIAAGPPRQPRTAAWLQLQVPALRAGGQICRAITLTGLRDGNTRPGSSQELAGPYLAPEVESIFHIFHIFQHGPERGTWRLEDDDEKPRSVVGAFKILESVLECPGTGIARPRAPSKSPCEGPYTGRRPGPTQILGREPC